MKNYQEIWCIIAKSKVKGTKQEFRNPIILCAYKTFQEAQERIKTLKLDEEYLEFKYELESTNLHL